MPDRDFLEDLNPPGCLTAVTLRSPAARGRLAGIDLPRLPTSCAFIQASDIPGANRLETYGTALPILAKDRISYIGEPVALLVGPNPAQLERLAEECVVRVDSETPVFNFEKFSSEQLSAKRTAVIGDPDAAFKQAAHIVESVYRTDRQEHWYAETQGALAAFNYDKLSVVVASQWPFHVRRTVSAVLAVRPEDVVVETSAIGLHLDGKIWYPSLLAAQAALAAFVCRKPIKLQLSRWEDLRFSPKRPAVTIRHRAAVGGRGELLALESRSTIDVGAAGPFAEEMLDRLCLGSLGAYRCPNVRVEGFAVQTNTPPAGPFAGFGLSQAFFAIEQHADRMAASAGVDPVEWRIAHALGRGDRIASGAVLKEAVPTMALIDTAVAMSGYRRKWAAYELLRRSRRGTDARRDGPMRGVGVAFAYQGNGFLSSGDDKGNYSVEVTLEKDGRLEIRSSAVTASRISAALWRRAAADILAIDDSVIRLAPNRTDLVPDSGPSSLSRNVTIVTKLIERCCQTIRKQRFRDPLPITVRRSYRPPQDGAWDGARMEGSPFALFSWAAAVVETEIDLVDYRPVVRGVWLAVDGGKILSETKARSSLELSVQHALSWAQVERLKLDEGAYRPADPLAYPMLDLADVPPMTIEFAWNDSTVPKGIGELPFACVPAAYACALSQATDRGFDSLPIGRDEIYRCLEEKA